MRRAVFSTLSLLVLSAAARAESTNCTEITSVPTHIFTPGIYCLKQSLSYSGVAGSAIQINVGDVVLDLNGHVLDNSSAGAGTISVGINGRNLKNVTVRNGPIRGFRFGVQLADLGDKGSVRVTVAGNRVANMQIGISASSPASALYVDNTVGGATAAFIGGTKAGTANHSF